MPFVRLLKDIITTLSHVMNDIITLKNIEKYVVAFSALFFAVAGLFGDVIPDNLKVSVGLGALGLLVFGLSQREDENSVEKILNNRKDLKPLVDSLKTATELWIYAPSAANILHDTNLIEEQILSNPRGHLRVLIQNPANKEAINILIDHLDKGTIRQNNQPMERAIQSTREQLETLAQRSHHGRLSYGFLNYGLGFSVVIFNPQKSDGYVILEIHGFQNEFIHNRMHIRINRQDSEAWYDYWVGQMTAMWDKAEHKYDNKA